MAVETGQPAAPSGVRGILVQKRGPLPVWAWLALGLALLLAVVWWRHNRAAGDATAVATGDGTPLPGDQAAPPVFIVPAGPPGPPGPPGTPGAPGSSATPPPTTGPVDIPPVRHPRGVPAPATVPTAPPGAGRDTPPATTPTVPKPVPAPTGIKVTVTKYTKSNPSWSSTLSGIAAHFHIADWHTIWNHPLNSALRTKRGAANRIQPGDQVYVPGVR